MTAEYGRTYKICCLANFLQAIGVVFPLLLIPLKTLYGLTYTQYGVLVVLNFSFQLASDIGFSSLVDRFGFRFFAVIAPIFSSLGLLLFAMAPILFPHQIFFGLALGIVVYAIAGGLQELLLSPIVDAIPFEEKLKARKMSLLHSFFAWGQLFIIPVFSISLQIFGMERWNVILLGLATLPLISSLLFCFAPLHEKYKEGERMGIRGLIQARAFQICVLAIILGGATEVTMAQWASAFLDRALDLPKQIGDIAGVCGFAFFLALGRTLYGLFGGRFSIHNAMIVGSALSVCTYLTAAMTHSALIGLLACALTGFTVSLLWPGSITVASRLLPAAGSSLFALMSASGDIGASLGSLVMGKVADFVALHTQTSIGLSGERFGLKVALGVSAVFPLMALFIHILLKKQRTKTLGI